MHKHRIRCVGIVMEKDSILMVLHKHQSKEEYWLMPPGGGLVEGESVLAGAVREVFEETGLRTTPERIIYIRQFVEDERNYHNLEIYVLLRKTGGELVTGYDPEEETQYIQDAGFYTKEQLANSNLTIHPAWLLDRFWTDRDSDFPASSLYQGMVNVEEERR
ncbi:NUDIX hydrolase [Clostridia bacterium]|nr:NUDIX hydrolase [Clostridia bacterium]